MKWPPRAPAKIWHQKDRKKCSLLKILLTKQSKFLENSFHPNLHLKSWGGDVGFPWKCNIEGQGPTWREQGCAKHPKGHAGDGEGSHVTVSLSRAVGTGGGGRCGSGWEFSCFEKTCKCLGDKCL